MRIIIKWLPQAITLLDNIYRFYSEKSQTAAIRLYNRLLDSAEPLRVFPQAGPIVSVSAMLPLFFKQEYLALSSKKDESRNSFSPYSRSLQGTFA